MIPGGKTLSIVRVRFSVDLAESVIQEIVESICCEINDPMSVHAYQRADLSRDMAWHITDEGNEDLVEYLHALLDEYGNTDCASWRLIHY